MGVVVSVVGVHVGVGVCGGVGTGVGLGVGIGIGIGVSVDAGVRVGVVLYMGPPRGVGSAPTAGPVRPSAPRARETIRGAALGWHYLSDATCRTRPHLFCALFIVSRVTIICQRINHF